jgi:hypothetical protein
MANLHECHGFAVPIVVVLPMSNASVKVAIALFIFLIAPAASFARGGGGHGGGHAGFAAMGAFARPAGSGGVGNVPISGVPRGPANVGGLNNSTVDPSGIGRAASIATLPQPHIAAPTPPGGSRNPAAPGSMNVEPQPVGEVSGGHDQPRADQVPSETNLTNSNSPANQQNAAFDRSLNICRGC